MRWSAGCIGSRFLENAIEVDDGMVFDPGSVTVVAIREEAAYGGLRVTVKGQFGTAKCQLQLDVGYGDVVTPGAVEVDYPVLLDDVPAPRLKVYPRETVVAEKLEAIAATFQRRGTVQPDALPLGLTAEFATAPGKPEQWAGFLRKNRLEGPPFEDVVAELGTYFAEHLTNSRS